MIVQDVEVSVLYLLSMSNTEAMDLKTSKKVVEDGLWNRAVDIFFIEIQRSSFFCMTYKTTHLGVLF